MIVVTTRDVDGSSRRSYKSRAAALARFEDMSGHRPEDVIDEMHFDLAEDARPTRATVARMRTVSSYGTVVIFDDRGC